jgi:hypothetical protein
VKALVVSLIVALICAVAFVACERVVVLTPFPGDAGGDAGFVLDGFTDFDGGSHLDAGNPFPDAFVGPG